MPEQFSIGGLPLIADTGSRAITHENRTGARGAGGKAGAGRKGSPAKAPLEAGEVFEMASIEGPGCIRHIWITTPPDDLEMNRNLIIRAYWDDQPQPSVEVPLTDFFGCAHGRRRPYFSALTVMPEGRGLNCYFPMPFRESARITVENDSGRSLGMFFYQVDYAVGEKISSDTAYFHAQFRRQPRTELKNDYVILDGVKGQGRFIGCNVGIIPLFGFWWGEGEFKFYLDGDEDYPTICGTGSEDYALSAWGLTPYHAPYSGCLIANGEPRTGLIAYYRYHVLEPIYFQESVKLAVQQIGCAGAHEAAPTEKWKKAVEEGIVMMPDNPSAPGELPKEGYFLFERADDYCSTAYWYQTLPTQPFPRLPGRAARTAGIERREWEKK